MCQKSAITGTFMAFRRLQPYSSVYAVDSSISICEIYWLKYGSKHMKIVRHLGGETNLHNSTLPCAWKMYKAYSVVECWRQRTPIERPRVQTQWYTFAYKSMRKVSQSLPRPFTPHFFQKLVVCCAMVCTVLYHSFLLTSLGHLVKQFFSFREIR